MRNIVRYKWIIVTSFIIILLYFFLRIYNLTVLPIFADEAIYIRWAQVMSNESTLRFLPLSDGKQPLFMWTIIPALKIFDDPLIAGRMVSVATGFGTLVGIFLLTFYLFRKIWIALAAAFIYTISPFAVFFDRMALVDSMLTMFGIWVLLLAISAVKALRWDLAMLTGFSLGGALLTKSPALFFSLLLPITVLFSRWPKRVPDGTLHLIKLLGLFIPAYIIGYGMYNILRLGPNFHLIGQRNQDYVLPLSHLWTNPKDPFIFHAHRSLEWLWMLGPAVLVILAGAGLVWGLRKYKRETLVLSAWAIIPILVQAEFAKVITARYILFSLPTLIILAIIIFNLKHKLTPFILGIVLTIFTIQAGMIDYKIITKPENAPLPQSERSGYLEEWTAGVGIREAAEFFQKEYQKEPDKKIVVGTEGYFGTLPDGLQIYLKNYPKITVIGTGLSFQTVPKSLLESKAFGNKTYLVVNSSRFNDKFKINDYTKLGLNLVISYPKPKRARNDTHEFFFYGEQDYLYLFEVKEDALVASSKQ